MRPRDQHCRCTQLAAVVLLLLARCEAFQEGDYVPVARRGQFAQVRTNWHDLLGRYCPRFSVNRMVAIPIPHPVTGEHVGTYKLMLSIAGDRLYTPWLKLMGPSAPSVPFLDVTLTRTGNDITSVKAQVTNVPEGYLHLHKQLEAEWSNATAWPKHLLVEYKWTERHEVNAIPGLYVLFSTCLIAGLFLVVSTLATNQDKLLEFVEDMAAEDPLALAGQAAASSSLDAPYRAAAAPKAD